MLKITIGLVVSKANFEKRKLKPKMVFAPSAARDPNRDLFNFINSRLSFNGFILS